MTDTPRKLRVFISCPNDVDSERKLVREVCAQISLAKKNDAIELEPLDWKEDINHMITGSDPQSTIDREFQDHDIYVGIMWKRYGERREDDNLSPTAHEFALAYERQQKTGSPAIKFLFKKPDVSPEGSEEIKQRAAVLEFQDQLKPLALFDEFTGMDDLRKKLFNDLCDISERFDEIVERNRAEHNQKKKERPEQTIDPPRNEETLPVERVETIAPSDADRQASPLPHDHESAVYSFLGGRGKEVNSVLSETPRLALVTGAGEGKTKVMNDFVGSVNASGGTASLVRISELTDPLSQTSLAAKLTAENNILVDGFDEIEDHNRTALMRQIEAFSEANPSVHIAVSARSNFMSLPEDTSSGTLKGFQPYALSGLRHDPIMRFLERVLADKREHFLNVLPQHVGDLLVNPFYLDRLVNLYRQGCSIENKGNAFEALLRDRFRDDCEHFRTSFIDLPDAQGQAEMLLERLAVAMETLCRNWISHDEYLALIPSSDNRRLLGYCGVWEKRFYKEGVRWSFQHNGFQEYLAARVLRRLPLKTLQSFVAFPPSWQEFIPSWGNTLTFVLDAADRQDVLDWVFATDPGLVVKSDPSNLDATKRQEIFRSIYDNCKKKDIWIDRDRYPIRSLAQFADDRDTVKVLLDEGESPVSRVHLGNTIYLLRFVSIPYSEEHRAIELFVGIALDQKQEETVRSLAIFALSNQNMDSKDVVDRLVSVLGKSDNDWVRYSLYSLLHNSDHLDENVDVFLQGIPYIRSRVGNRGESRLMNEGTELCEGINKLTAAPAIKKALAYFAESPSDLDEIRVKVSEEGLFLHAARAYETDKSLYDDAMSCFKALMANYVEKEAGMLATFFEKTGTRLRAFEEILKDWQDIISKEQALTMLADKECLQHLVELCRDGKIEKDVIYSVRNLLRNTWKPDADWFLQHIVSELGADYEMPPPVDYEQKQRDERQQSVALLFDKTAFIDHVKRVLSGIGKDVITYDDISNIRYRERQEHDYPRLVMTELSQLLSQKELPKDEILQIVEKWDWKWFCVTKLYELMSSSQPIDLSEEQTSIIAGWCECYLAEVDFRSAITIQGERTSYKWLAIYLWFFFRRLDLAYPKEVLLDMISFEYFEPESYRGIEYLSKYLSAREIRNRVMENLEAGIPSDLVLTNHLRYCEKHEELDAIPYAQVILADSGQDDSVRTAALDLIKSLAPEELADVLPKVSDVFRWYIVEEILKNHPDTCVTYLRELVEAGDEEKDNAICYLASLGDITGLGLYVERTRELKHVIKKPWMLKQNPIASFSSMEAVPLLLELLELSYSIDKTDDVFGDTLYRLVQDALNTLAYHSEGNHKEVRDAVTTFIADHKDLPDVNFLHVFLERLETEFYRRKTEQLSMSDVLNKLEGAGI